ncbi:MAG: hypothetical protein KGM18_04490 [Sphingomonadales bacterium]|nr:hypothetical protein [Sphingomonadales bacterium]
MATLDRAGSRDYRGKDLIRFPIMKALALTGLAFAVAVAAQARRPAPVVLRCEVPDLAKSQLGARQICDRFVVVFARVLQRPVVGAVSASGPSARDTLRVEITQPRRNAIEARLSGRYDGRTVARGPIAIDVMDRALAHQDVDRLAETLARLLDSRPRSR